MRKRLIVANWKENKTNDETAEFMMGLKEAMSGKAGAEVVICPSFVSIITASDCARGSGIRVGAQDLSVHDSGAFTGEVSAGMIRDFCNYAIVGHSERRRGFGETDSVINSKAKNAMKNNISPIICVGEGLEERNSGQAESFVLGQVSGCLEGIPKEDAARIVIAYEPVWAISCGDSCHEPATHDDAQNMHAIIRNRLSELYGSELSSQIRIIYGGSVKPVNIRGFLEKEDIDGVLVGSASLDVGSFLSLLGP